MSPVDDTHETRIQAYALGWLSAQERAELDAQAASDPKLHAELALARAMAQARAEDPARGQSTAFGWARLSRALDDQATAPQRSRWLPDRFSRWQTAAAVLAAVALWQLAAVPHLPGERGDAATGYGMASAPRTHHFMAQVAFKPEATELQIREALLQAHASVVAGPSTLGLYDLSFADQRALDAGLAQLNANPTVVELAAPADTDGDSTQP